MNIKIFDLFPIPLVVQLLRPEFFVLGVGIQHKYIEFSFGWIAVGVLYNGWWQKNSK